MVDCITICNTACIACIWCILFSFSKFLEEPSEGGFERVLHTRKASSEAQSGGTLA
ncbi:hypothetical protein X777_04217 [Ooceraea biroi]|uniref:Uncharacterized protein n=1 Tax=Ooceraea biroi TaxID=2015173 RepID=A0A026WKR5_OOCBI|nr:hypothetical protein X777_04217 [Ooceraea biroi]